MNAKTTIALLFMLGASVLLLVAVRRQPADAKSAEIATPAASSPIARQLLKEKLGDVTKIVVRRAAQPEWVFEKGGNAAAASPEWKMTAPVEMKTTGFEVDRIARDLTRLQFEISYKTGQPGAVSAKDAGLDPPQAAVELTDVDKKSAKIEIGGPASDQSTYVRLAGSDEIVVASASLRNLFKTKPVEYRDKQLWVFDPTAAKRVEITDRTNPAAPVDYVFVADGSRWNIESPSPGRATGKVADMLKELGRLRAVAWMDDAKDKLPAFGLEPAALTVRVTAEIKTPTPAPAEPANDAPEPKPADEPKVEVKTFVAHVSNRSPIGEDTKVYVRAGDESAVGTIMKTTADKLTPSLKDWRDMHLTFANVAGATKVEIAGPQGASVLVKKEGRWLNEADGAPADEAAVTSLLDAVRDLNAVAFVDASPAELAAAGFDRPQVDLKLTVPGTEAVERITIGNHTDATSKLLVFARRNEAAPLAKVRAVDVEKLVQGPLAFMDRSVIDVPADSIDRLALSVRHLHSSERMNLVFDRDGKVWKLSSPVSAAIRQERVQQLVDGVAHLRAESILATRDEATAFGLQDPAAVLTLTIGSNDDAAAARLVELRVTQHDGRYVAQVAGRPTVYAIPEPSYANLFLEFRSAEVFSFDATRVTSFTVKQGTEAFAFQRAGGKWALASEPDLPLDAKKVEDLLLRVRDLKIERYAAYGAIDPAKFALDNPAREIAVVLDDGSKWQLQISALGSRDDAHAGAYAAVQDRPEVFLLDDATLSRTAFTLKDLQ